MTKHELPAWVTDLLADLPVERELPKWPVLTVVGENVSPELGREICVRTTLLPTILPWEGQGDAWGKIVGKAYGVEGDSLDCDEEDRLAQELGSLRLEYLGNDRVTASRFEIPSGWCNWDGTIGTTGTYGDAKWPSLKGLNSEVTLIAQTWPELTMTMQLSTYKSAETFDEYHPFLTWDIQHGCAVLRREPGEALCPVELPGEDIRKVTADMTRGTDAETLRQAVAEAKEKIRAWLT